MSDSTPRMNASLFQGHKHSDKIDYSGTLSVSAEDLRKLAAYASSDNATADEYGVKFYMNGWKRETRNGKNYISISIEPPKQAYEDSLNGSGPLPDEEMPF